MEEESRLTRASRQNENFVNTSRFQAVTKLQLVGVLELQYVDDSGEVS